MGNVFKYLQYLPLLVALVNFVRTAERDFKGAGNNTEKAAWVAARFREFVQLFGTTGLVSQTAVQKLQGYADAFVTVIVQMLNLTGGVEPLPAEEPEEPTTDTPTPATKFPYNEELLTSPLAMDEGKLLVSGDRIWRNSGAGRAWLVKSKDDPTRDEPPAVGWLLTSQQP